MFFSTVSPTFSTFARLGSRSKAIILGKGAVLDEELTVFELPIMEQTLLHQDVSFTRVPHP
jgi:hypothetical protein